MNDIITTICGNIATDPKHQITVKGQALTSFRLASTPRKFDQEVQGYVDGETTWVNVSCWGALAFNTGKSLHKGQPVVVNGTLRSRHWQTDDGKTGTDFDLTAYTVGHDLRRGSSEFRKVSRSGVERRPGPRHDELSAPTEHEEGADDFEGLEELARTA